MTPKFTVLAVDDEPNNLTVLGRVLSGAGHRVLVAPNGEAALRLATSQKPDLILLDVVMPGLDGYEVCTKLKTGDDTKEIPVIFVTSMSDLDYETKGFKAGGVDYVVKPVNSVILLARVNTHLELKHKTDLLRSLATLDGLTGIHNRRKLDEFLEQEWWRCIRGGSGPLSLIMLDIDYFKNYNDHYGHLQGDQCLRLVAQSFQNSLERTTDFVARYGGEEFCCVMPVTSQKGAIYMAEKIKAGIAKQAIPHEKSTISPFVTVSMGVATVFPSSCFSPTDLVMVADRQLYQAKQEGRNRFFSVGPEHFTQAKS
ncbi:two-component system, chemotaxis family, response regulator WspR [Gammaproteobacteria bacterium]